MLSSSHQFREVKIKPGEASLDDLVKIKTINEIISIQTEIEKISLKGLK